jgi:hypothetical protein
MSSKRPSPGEFFVRLWRLKVARVIKPPTPITLAGGERSVFLAGSIEMGRAEQWQATFESSLADLPVAVLNPRRDEWDAGWEQSISNPVFREQVEWELEGLERASLIAMHFAPTTQAPVTLLELGLMARSAKLVVSCPPGYWRRGNVEVTCARFKVPLVAGLPELVEAVRRQLRAEPAAELGSYVGELPGANR